MKRRFWLFVICILVLPPPCRPASVVPATRVQDTLPPPAVRTVKRITLTQIVPTPTVSTPEAKPAEQQIYVVKVGDTLTEIAQKYNVPLFKLAFANSLKNPNLIYQSQKLLIPSEISFHPKASRGGKQIVISLSEQTTYIYQEGVLLKEFVVSTGKPSTPSPTGTFWIWIKTESTNMEGGTKGVDYYNLKSVPFVMFFKNDEVSGSEGYSMHGTYWHNNFGIPTSHGCINLKIDDAKWLYNWAEVGTIITIIN